jgi:hypothetical protein
MEQQAVTEDQYNATLAAAYKNQTADQEDVDQFATPLPEGGQEKYYNPTTGEYNWAAHAKEAEYRLVQARTPQEEQQQLDQEEQQEQSTEAQPWERAGLDGEELANKIVLEGNITEDDYAALAQAGYPRSFVESYIDGMLSQIDSGLEEQYNYVGGDEAWDELKTWANQNLSSDEQGRIENLLQVDYRAAVDLLNLKRGTIARDPQLLTADGAVGSSFGYRSKAEMKADMASPKYVSDPLFRQDVARKMRSASWDLDPSY